MHALLALQPGDQPLLRLIEALPGRDRIVQIELAGTEQEILILAQRHPRVLRIAKGGELRGTAPQLTGGFAPHLNLHQRGQGFGAGVLFFERVGVAVAGVLLRLDADDHRRFLIHLLEHGVDIGQQGQVVGGFQRQSVLLAHVDIDDRPRTHAQRLLIERLAERLTGGAGAADQHTLAGLRGRRIVEQDVSHLANAVIHGSR